uniref:Unnamed protein product n=1 Tax=Macaca fascicularis TaxID=9541 RepID=Q9N094_MACFA|nr:unnamed protein product [Macaca fascicularis]
MYIYQNVSGYLMRSNRGPLNKLGSGFRSFFFFLISFCEFFVFYIFCFGF